MGASHLRLTSRGRRTARSGQKESCEINLLPKRAVPMNDADKPTELQLRDGRGVVRDRAEQARKVIDFEAAKARLVSERGGAEEVGVARTTLLRWVARSQAPKISPAAYAFFESPEGVELLHCIQCAAHVAMNLVGPCGVRPIALFLRLSTLDRFIASSDGAQSKVNRAIERVVVDFGRVEGARLGAQMPQRSITAAIDETFHPRICLVALDPVTGFILLERYADKRDTATWTQAMKEAMAGFRVVIHQVAGDQAKAIGRFATVELGGHMSPDVFHVQYSMSRGTASILARRQRHAEAAFEQAQAHLLESESVCCALNNPDVSREIRELTKGVADDARNEKVMAEAALKLATEDRDQMRKAIADVGAVYHPFDLKTGHMRDVECVQRDLLEVFDRARALYEKAGLPEYAYKGLDKAKRVVSAMCATIAYVHSLIAVRLSASGASTEMQTLLFTLLIPALYQQRVARKTKGADARAKLTSAAEGLLAKLHEPNGLWAALTPTKQQLYMALAVGCADLFQRSSSCVEGRNGQLALRHHGLHLLSERRLAALTTIHNYFLVRPDGTTAAERFFGQRPQALFNYVCAHVPLPSRPRRTTEHAAA